MLGYRYINHLKIENETGGLLIKLLVSPQYFAEHRRFKPIRPLGRGMDNHSINPGLD